MLRRAAEDGLVVKQASMGFPVRENEQREEAARWFRRSAEQGDIGRVALLLHADGDVRRRTFWSLRVTAHWPDASDEIGFLHVFLPGVSLGGTIPGRGRESASGTFGVWTTGRNGKPRSAVRCRLGSRGGDRARPRDPRAPGDPVTRLRPARLAHLVLDGLQPDPGHGSARQVTATCRTASSGVRVCERHLVSSEQSQFLSLGLDRISCPCRVAGVHTARRTVLFRLFDVTIVVIPVHATLASVAFTRLFHREYYTFLVVTVGIQCSFLFFEWSIDCSRAT